MQHQLHIVADTSITSGGEGLAALRYAEHIAHAGCHVTLISLNGMDAPLRRVNGAGSIGIHLIPEKSSDFISKHISYYSFIQKLCNENQVELIHIHGMWNPVLAMAAAVSKRNNISLILSPHGCVEPVALNYKYYKKWLALITYQGCILRNVSLFVATAEQEKDSIRRLGYKQPIAVIPNGVDVTDIVVSSQKTITKTILFLSRLHPKKGLEDLIESWSRVRKDGWKIIIAGDGDRDYREFLERLIGKRGLESDFEFMGFVTGVSKQACFESADIFILPTHSENFGLVVAEALVNELPVITTTGAPWKDLVDYQCGWWVEPNVEGISKALVEAMSFDHDQLRAMGQRGRQLVIDKYSWVNIGTTALNVCEWLLERSHAKPPVVDLQCEVENR
jgi:glycosyltransferase involved in cell wall biosynthesis